MMNPENILIIVFHIKLELIKKFIKALSKDATCFIHLCQKFPSWPETVTVLLLRILQLVIS